MMSTAAYSFYNPAGESPPSPVFNQEPRMMDCSSSELPTSALGIMSIASKHHRHPSEMLDDLAFLPLMEDSQAVLSGMDHLHPLNFAKKHSTFSEPTSVLDMHMAPSPVSSPSRSSAQYDSESSARSVTSRLSPQQSLASLYSGYDSPGHYNFAFSSGDAKSKFEFSTVSSSGQSSAAAAASGGTSWATCMSDPHYDHGDDVLDLSVLEHCEAAATHEHKLEISSGSEAGSHKLDRFTSGTANLDLGGFDQSMIDLLPEPDHEEVLADPLCPLMLQDEHREAVANSLSKMLASDKDSSPLFKFENFQHGLSTQAQAAVHFQSRRGNRVSEGQLAKHGGNFAVDPEQPQCQGENGLYLVQLLLGGAQAVEEGNYKLGRSMLSRLTGLASPFGGAMQRIAVYFGGALEELIHDKEMSRMNNDDPTYIHTMAPIRDQPNFQSILSMDSHVAYQAFYQVLPYVKFAHLTANQAILEAVGTDEHIHVVDLDIGQGLQWPSFIQSLAVQDYPNSRPFHLKITGVGSNFEALQQTGRRLCEFAASVQVLLEFHAVEETCLQNLDAGILRVHRGENLAVSCPSVLSRSLGGPNYEVLEGVLSMVNRLKPAVVTIVETELNNHSPSLLSRFVEGLQHYSALFDCLEATLGRSSAERLRIEKLRFGSEIRNILAADRSDRRARHARTENWQHALRRAGFRDLDLSGYALYQAKLLLGLFNANEAYKLTGMGTALNLGWHDTPIITVSAWTC